MSPEVIQIVIQGGAVGILLVFGVGIYKLARVGMDYFRDLVTNHLAHILTELGAMRTSIDLHNSSLSALLNRADSRGERLERFLDREVAEVKRSVQAVEQQTKPPENPMV